MLFEGLLGLAVGISARYVIPDPGSGGLGGDTLAGILGGLLAAFVYKLFGPDKPPVYAWNAWSLLSAAAGGVAFILIVRGVGGRRTIA